MLSIICGARVAAQPPPLGSETRESVVSDIRRTRLITPQIVRRERRGGPKIRRTRLMTDLPLQARGGMILAKAYAPYPLIIATKATPARPRCAVGASQAHRTPEASGAFHAPLWPGRSSIGNRRCISCVPTSHPTTPPATGSVYICTRTENRTNLRGQVSGIHEATGLTDLNGQ